MELSITNVLIGITCLISYMGLNNRELFNKLKHYPYQEARSGQYYRWLSSGFLHGSMMHLLINMFVLYQIGNITEDYYQDWFGPILGRNLYLLMYLATIVAADVITYSKHKDNPSFASIGASGATSGILLIFCLVHPYAWFIWPPLPGILLAIGYIWYSSYASRQAQSGGIDHDAHLYGAVFGLLFTISLKPSLFLFFIDNLKDFEALKNGIPFLN